MGVVDVEEEEGVGGETDVFPNTFQSHHFGLNFPAKNLPQNPHQFKLLGHEFNEKSRGIIFLCP